MGKPLRAVFTETVLLAKGYIYIYIYNVGMLNSLCWMLANLQKQSETHASYGAYDKKEESSCALCVCVVGKILFVLPEKKSKIRTNRIFQFLVSVWSTTSSYSDTGHKDYVVSVGIDTVNCEPTCLIWFPSQTVAKGTQMLKDLYSSVPTGVCCNSQLQHNWLCLIFHLPSFVCRYFNFFIVFGYYLKIF